jgi:hypothetical protein
MEWGSARKWLSSRAGWMFILATYAGLRVATASTYAGDTRDYANSIVARFGDRDLYFWEFGHLLWRPVGYAAVFVARLTPGGEQASSFPLTVRLLVDMSVVAGALTLIAFLAWLKRLGVAWMPAVVATLAMGLSCTLLNYAQTGTAYIPALSLLCVALWSVARADDIAPGRISLLGVAAISLSVLLWLPMIFVVPAVVLSPLVLRGDTPTRRHVTGMTFALAALFIECAYGAVVLVKGLHSFPALTSWVASASHGIHDSGGLSRAIVGFARSVLSTDQLGLVAKRHMLGDPYNPASLGDVVRGGLYRLVVFYGAIAAIIILLVRTSRGRRALIEFALFAAPVLVMAVAWQGGDLERYLPLFPALFMLLAVALAAIPPAAQRVAAAGVVVALCVLNIPDFDRGKTTRVCAEVARRLAFVPADTTHPPLVVTPLNSDEVTQARGLCASVAQLEDAKRLRVVGLITPHEKLARLWRTVFATDVTKAWSAGSRVWLSTRAYATRPASDWGWAEGDDPSVHWRDLSAFLGRLDRARSRGNGDEFVEILPTSANLRILDSAAGSVQLDTMRFIAAPRGEH